MQFTKEQLIDQAQKNIAVLRGAVERMPGASEAAVIHLRLAEITLAALTAEPVAYMVRDTDSGEKFIRPDRSYFEGPCQSLYTAPPAPVVPKELLSAMEEVLRISDRDHDAWHKAKAGIVSCRAAMLQGAAVNSPAIPDGYALVPVELTGAMTNAMTDAILDDLHNVDVWRSVLAAAPQQEVK